MNFSFVRKLYGERCLKCSSFNMSDLLKAICSVVQVTAKYGKYFVIICKDSRQTTRAFRVAHRLSNEYETT